MQLIEVSNLVKEQIVNSPIFPYRTGQLKENFIDVGSDISLDNNYSFTILSNPVVYYGKILEDRASIRYRTKNHIIRHKNRHFRYIDRIIESEIVPEIEREFGVRRIDET